MSEWRIIPSVPSYAASSNGEIRRVLRGRGTRCRILRQKLDANGYFCITLSLGSRQSKRTFLVSRLVCEAFRGPPPTPEHEAAHYDGNCANNAEANLRWATQEENHADKVRHGTSPAKLTVAQVREIRSALADPQRTMTQTEMAAKYGVTPGLITNIKAGRCWVAA